MKTCLLFIAIFALTAVLVSSEQKDLTPFDCSSLEAENHMLKICGNTLDCRFGKHYSACFGCVGRVKSVDCNYKSLEPQQWGDLGNDNLAPGSNDFFLNYYWVGPWPCDQNIEYRVLDTHTGQAYINQTTAGSWSYWNVQIPKNWQGPVKAQGFPNTSGFLCRPSVVHLYGH